MGQTSSASGPFCARALAPADTKRRYREHLVMPNRVVATILSSIIYFMGALFYSSGFVSRPDLLRDTWQS